jgi:hypothetical protein
MAVTVALATCGAYLIYDGNAAGAAVVFVTAVFCWVAAIFCAAVFLLTVPDVEP